MSSLQFLAETHVFGILIHPWKIVGLSGSLVFGLRFIIQWIASERARKSVIPFGFWECSALGSLLMLSYFAIYQRDSVGVLSTRNAAPDLSAQSLLSLHPPRAAAPRGMRQGRRNSATLYISRALVLKLFPSMISSEQIIYLDNNATTQLDPAVIEEMLPFLTKYFGNPSSGYTFGAQVRSAIDLARERVAALARV